MEVLEFITIGKCLNAWKKGEKWHYESHFKGVYKGTQLCSIFLVGKKNTQQLSINKTYIVHAKVIKQQDNHLYAKLLRVKPLEKIRSDFL